MTALAKFMSANYGFLTMSSYELIQTEVQHLILEVMGKKLETQ